jgi:hypothetical protein
MRDQGFKISIAMGAFYEAWAAAARQQAPNMIVSPARAFQDVVDPEYPLAPSAGDFLRRFKVARREGDCLTRRYREWSWLNWRLASRGEIDESSLVAVGLEADAYLTWRGETWKGYASAWRPRVDAALATTDPKAHEAALVALAQSGGTDRALQSHATREASEAFRQPRHAGSNGARAPGGAREKATSRLLPRDRPAHVEHGARSDNGRCQRFRGPLELDARRGARVPRHASKTYQAPWVRTLEQFFGLPLPTGRPWGISARLQAARFDRAAAS